MITLFCIIYGACLASFVPCFGERRRRHRSQMGRSHCTCCETPIAPVYLIPVFGYFFSKGRCAHCQAPIPKSLVCFEILGAILGGFLATHTTLFFHPILQLSAIAVLLLMSLDDWYTQWIHDRDLIVYGLILAIDILYCSTFFLSERLIGALMVSIPLLLIYWWRPGTLGSGDILFVTISGFYLGPIAMSYAFLIGILVALCYSVWLICSRGANRHTSIPLIPFLSFGVMCLFVFL